MNDPKHCDLRVDKAAKARFIMDKNQRGLPADIYPGNYNVVLPPFPTGHNIKYAGLWRRTVADAIDEVIILSLQCLSSLAFFCFWKEVWFDRVVQLLIQPSSFLSFSCLIVILPLVCTFIIVPWLYVALSEASSAQATPGKRILNLSVFHAGGKQISFVQATKKLAIQYILLPFLVLLVSTVACAICQGRICGFLDIYVTFYVISLILWAVISLVSLVQILFTETRQSVIDKLCGRFVLVHEPDSSTLSDSGVRFGAIAAASAITALSLAVCWINNEPKKDSQVMFYDNEIRHAPNDWQAFYYRSIRESKLGQDKDALRDYVKAVNVHIPEWNKIIAAHANDENWMASALLEKVDAIARIGQYREAEAECTRFLAKHPHYEQLEQFLIVRAFAREAQGKHDGAIDDCTEALRLNSKDGEAYYWRAVARKTQGNSQMFRTDTQRSMQLKPADKHAHVNRVASLVMIEKGVKAGFQLSRE